jgi:multidrug efflux pump subunit AcrA (membrane-fusion protein)
MYVNVHVKLPLGRQSVVPASAIFHSGTRNLIFAYQGEGNIQPRDVEVGARVGDDVVIRKGVHAGDQIIASANFLIDSEAQLQAAASAFMPRILRLLSYGRQNLLFPVERLFGEGFASGQ